MQFPVAVLKKNDPIIYVYEDYETMRKTSEELLKQNIWQNCELVDSRGKKYYVSDVKKVGLRGLWGWHPLLKGKSIWVDFIFSEEGEISIENLKEVVLSKIDKKKSFWESAWDINDLKAKIKNSVTIKEIIKILQ